ncbi:MAG: tRNA pseudouridine(55) synthase TruB [Peptococcaceae bacterium]|nr:tRNA pseudouridine(55) synthase TruB [Peptococcaceae bacterium]
MEGVLNLLKPPGMTSHDVVNVVRKALKIKKVGHTGTLDPYAAGVIVLCIGRATRIARFLTATSKEYRAEITFGISTDTQDALGHILHIKDASHVDENMLHAMLPKFTGTIQQVPPMVSAIKRQGKKLYELARKGYEVKREPREVTIYRIDMVKFWGKNSPHPRLMFDVSCSKGTYIRTLCSDIGDALATGAHMSFLLRTRVGRFTLTDALTLEKLTELAKQERLADHIIPIDNALDYLPAVNVKPTAVKSVLSGRTVYSSGVKGDTKPFGPIVRLRSNGYLLALAEVIQLEQSTAFKPVWVRSSKQEE